MVFQWWSSVNWHNWNTLEDHWSHEYTGMPLEPHWLMLAPSGVPVLICIGTHWKTTGKPLEDHWKYTGYQQFFLQWHSSVHWGLSSRHTGLPLEDHWLRVRVNTLRSRQNGRNFPDDNSKCIFLNENDLTEVWSLGSNEQYSSNGSDNGLAPFRRQAIIWTNAG